MFFMVFVLVAALAPPMVFAWSTGAADRAGDAEYHKIPAEEAKELMDSGEPYVLLDVRTAAEFSEGHIEGAVLIPDDEIVSRAPETLIELDALILIYCRSGRRSAGAAHTLVAMGYTNVYDFGGILEWPYETVRAAE